MMKKLMWLVWLVCCVAAPMTLPASAQQTCGGIKGRVTTEEGWVIPGANIRLANKRTKQRVSAQSNGEGEYTMCLEAGVYDVFADAEGFKPAKRKSIEVDASAMNIIDFVMKRGKPVVVDGRHP